MNQNQTKPTLHLTPSIFSLFDNDVEYPSQVAERGVPRNTCYNYISHTYLNGLINYVTVKDMWMIERYRRLITTDTGLEVFVDKNVLGRVRCSLEDLSTIADDHGHTNLGLYPDDVLLLAETDHDWWFFWFDHDVSDCCIGRLDKDRHTYEYVALAVINFIKNAKIGGGERTGRYWSLPLPCGWKSF